MSSANTRTPGALHTMFYPISIIFWQVGWANYDHQHWPKAVKNVQPTDTATATTCLAICYTLVCASQYMQLFNCSGLHESLHMTVAIPMLWGIPPRHETLRYGLCMLAHSACLKPGVGSCCKTEDVLCVCSTAIVSGGGYVDKVYRQWQLYGS